MDGTPREGDVINKESSGGSGTAGANELSSQSASAPDAYVVSHKSQAVFDALSDAVLFFKLARSNNAEFVRIVSQIATKEELNDFTLERVKRSFCVMLLNTYASAWEALLNESGTEEELLDEYFGKFLALCVHEKRENGNSVNGLAKRLRNAAAHSTLQMEGDEIVAFKSKPNKETPDIKLNITDLTSFLSWFSNNCELGHITVKSLEDALDDVVLSIPTSTEQRSDLDRILLEFSDKTRAQQPSSDNS